MLKKILLALVMFYGALAYAAVDVNKATAAQLDGIKGIGPGKSTAILAERKKSEFKDWEDLIQRVPGIGAINAKKLSNAGLTVGGKIYDPVKASTQAKDDKKATKKEESKAAAAKPAVKEEAKKDSPKAAASAPAMKDAPKAAASAPAMKDAPKLAASAPAMKDAPKLAASAPATKDMPKVALPKTAASGLKK